MSRTRLDLVLPATPVVPGVSSRLSLADGRGLFPSSTLSSDYFPKLLTAKRIGTKDRLLLVRMIKMTTSGGTRYRRPWVADVLRVRS